MTGKQITRTRKAEDQEKKKVRNRSKKDNGMIK